MTAQRLTMSMAGLFIVLSLVGAHFMGAIDMRIPSLLWFTAFVGANLFQAGFTGLCPMTWMFKKLGMS